MNVAETYTAIYMPLELTNRINSTVSKVIMDPSSTPVMLELQERVAEIQERLPLTDKRKFFSHPNYWTGCRDAIVSIITYHVVKSISNGSLLTLYTSILEGSYVDSVLVQQHHIDLMLGAELSEVTLETSTSYFFKSLLVKLMSNIFFTGNGQTFLEDLKDFSMALGSYLRINPREILLSDFKGESYFAYFVKGDLDESSLCSSGM